MYGRTEKSASGPPHTSKAMAAPCLLLGDSITDDPLLNIARFLPTTKDLLCLMLTNSRFAAKIIACGGSGNGRAASAAAAPEMVCQGLSPSASSSGSGQNHTGVGPQTNLRKRKGFVT